MDGKMDESDYHAPLPQGSKGSKLYRLGDSIKKASFILGSALFVFAAIRNSFHWHVHRIWGETGSFWQSSYDHVYSQWFNENDIVFMAVGTCVLTTLVFWGSNAIFLFLDITGKPSFLLKYKIQKNVKADRANIWSAVKLVLFNQFVVGIPFSIGWAYLQQYRGVPVSGELPTLHWVVFELLIISFIMEIVFYYFHRLLHYPTLYKRIHKVHHEWRASISIVINYSHPIEHIFSTLIPPALGPLLIGSHVATMWLWFCIAIMSSTNSHSGYHFPLLPSPEAHDYHHLNINQMFGVLGVLDRLHGTDIQFRASKQYERHSMLMNLTPLSQQYPDSPKKKPE